MSGRSSRGINYITAHDGFTLADLVSYTTKQNDANGENNRDGSDNNLSWNNGAEGPSTDPAHHCGPVAGRARAAGDAAAVARHTDGVDGRRARPDADTATTTLTHKIMPGPGWIGPLRTTALIEFTAAVIALRRTLAPLFDGRSLQGRPVDGALIADVTWLGADGQGIDWNQRPRPHADRRFVRG